MNFGALTSIMNPILDVAGFGYDIYKDQRNYRYTNDVQKQTWKREDTAIQRRKADLEAAGMNPFMAAGSGASAGAVLNPPNGSVRNVGSFLDGAMAYQQLKKAKEETNYIKEQIDLLKKQNNIASLQYQDSYYDHLDREDSFFYNRGLYRSSPEVGDGYVNYGQNDWSRSKPDLPFYNLLDFQIKNNRNSADLLQKQNDYYTSDKIMDYAGQLFPFLNMGRNYLNHRR